MQANRWLSLWFVANGISQLGNRVYALAVPWMAMSMTGSALYMNAVWAVEMLPFVVVGPFMGALVDRLDRRRVMVVADLGQALLVGLIPLLDFLGLLQLWHLFAAGFLLNSFAIAYNLVGDFGIIPRLVRGSELPVANSIHFAILNLSMVFGSAIGGVLITWITAPGALIFDAVSFLATMAVVMALPIDFGSRSQATAASIRAVAAEVAEGFRFMWRDGLIRALALLLSWMNLATGALFVTLTYHLGQEWQLPASQVGLGFGLLGGAAVIGSMLASAVIRRYPVGRAIAALAVAEAISLTIAALSGHWTIALAGLTVGTVADTILNVSTFTIRQKAIPNELMGRVNAAFRTVLTLAFPLSASLLGLMAEWSGGRAAFGLAAGMTALTAGAVILSPVGRYRLPREEADAA